MILPVKGLRYWPKGSGERIDPLMTDTGHSALRILALLALTFSSSVHGIRAQETGENCLVCHSNIAVFDGLENPENFVVSPQAFEGSVHEAFGLSCSSCHEEGDYPHAPEAGLSCSPCHADLESRYSESLHGHALDRGNPRAPNCSTCHGKHQILSSFDPRAATHRNRLPETCEACHGQEGLLTDQLVKLPQSYQQYANSVHGRGMAEDGVVAASCTDCHTIHDLRGATDPTSSINPLNVASTCGRCHQEVKQEYDQSIHGRALQAGVTDSPTCIDCHGAHLILSSSDPESPTCGARLARETCGKCHDDPVIISKYGLMEGVVASYLESYHGWASRTGCEVVASCSDCHGAHMVLPTEDPASTISPNNLVGTCATCHEGATQAFATSYNHRTASISGNPVNRVIRTIYLWAIGLIVGGLVLHNLVIMNFFMIKRRREQTSAGETVARFSPSQLAQHLSLTVSFIVLLVTGFALRYPEAWWVVWLARSGMSEGLRGDIHRVSAVVLILTSMYHGYYLLATRPGRKEMRALVLTRRDWTDMVENLRYHTFRSQSRVEFGRYNYTQKGEYWALVWGTMLMVVTGLVLWFPTVAVRFLPGVVIPASQTIHFYEACLAGLVILVWHFFFVVFHPEEYPMNWTWITGRMSKKAAQDHHGEWYRKEASELEDAAEVPAQPHEDQ